MALSAKAFASHEEGWGSIYGCKTRVIKTRRDSYTAKLLATGVDFTFLGDDHLNDCSVSK